MPTGKVIGGRLLNQAAGIVDKKVKGRLTNRVDVGLIADGWKAANRSAVNGIGANIDGKSYTLDLVEVTATIQFGAIIDRVESEYNCIVIYFTTDSDGGAKKGCILLGRERPWMLVP